MHLAAVPWLALGSGPWSRPHLAQSSELPSRASVAVIGAGITGLSCALTLAADGCDVVVLERDFGSGSTCRSGGLIIGDTAVGPAPGFSDCEFEVRNWLTQASGESAIDWCGCIELDRDETLSPRPIDWRDSGPVRRSRIVPGGTLDPSVLLTAMAGRTLATGGRIVDRATVTSLESDDDGVIVHVGEREMRASTVVVCVDATCVGTDFDPWPERLIAVVLETQPLPPDVIDAIGWSERLPFYTTDLPLLWGRLLPSGGMLVGRELVDTDLKAPKLERAVSAAGVRLGARLRRLHPALSDVEVARVWAGPIARDAAGIPGLRADPARPGVFWAGGYGGQGLAPAFRLGRHTALQLRQSEL